MPRIAADFSEEITTLLEKYQKQNNLNSIAQSLREIVESGLIEKGLLVTKKSSKLLIKMDIKKDEITVPKIAWKELLEWVCESRLYIRYLIASMPDQPKAIDANLLGKYKKRAVEYIEKKYCN